MNKQPFPAVYPSPDPSHVNFGPYLQSDPKNCTLTVHLLSACIWQPDLNAQVPDYVHKQQMHAVLESSSENLTCKCNRSTQYIHNSLTFCVIPGLTLFHKLYSFVFIFIFMTISLRYHRKKILTILLFILKRWKGRKSFNWSLNSNSNKINMGNDEL